MDIKHSKRIRKNITDPPESGTFSNFPPQTQEWKSDKDTTGFSSQPPKMHTSFSSISQAKRLTGNSCF